MAEYAPEYSQANQAKLVEGYNALQNPAAEKAKRQLAQSLAGTAGMYGGARSAGLGNIAAQQLANTGQYAQNLAQTGLQAGREERLTAENRAYEDPYRQAQLTGKWQGQDTLAGQQVGLQGQQIANQASQFGQSLAQQQKQYEGNLGLSKFQAEMPYKTQGYLDAQGNVITEQQLQENSPENQFAKSLGLPNGISMATLASSDPGAYQELLRTGKLPSSYKGGMYGSVANAPTPSGPSRGKLTGIPYSSI